MTASVPAGALAASPLERYIARCFCPLRATSANTALPTVPLAPVIKIIFLPPGMGTSRTGRTPWDPIPAGLIFFTSPQWYNHLAPAGSRASSFNPLSLTAWVHAAEGASQNKLQVAESHGPALESVQAGFGQRRNQLAKIEINMVTEVRDQAAPFHLPVLQNRRQAAAHPASEPDVSLQYTLVEPRQVNDEASRR